MIMKRIAKLLPDAYYLDKNFMPLHKKISYELGISPYYRTVDFNTLDDIVFDVLTMIKPKTKTVKGKVVFY